MCVYKENEHYLKQSIESILDQTFKDFEFIIILDNPDNQRAISLIEKYRKKDGRILFFINQENIGLVSSLNFGIKKAVGRYIARMDADDIAQKDRLKKQLAYLNNNNLKFIGCSMHRISENGELVNKLTNQSYPINCITKILKSVGDCVPHPSWLLEKAIYDQMGGYRKINLCEDYDFLLRAVACGIKVGVCDRALMNYRINSDGISQQNALRQQLTAMYLRKNFRRIDEVDQLEIDDYLRAKITDKDSKKYKEATAAINLAVQKVKKGDKSFVVQLLKAMYISRFAFFDIKNLITAAIITKKYK